MRSSCSQVSEISNDCDQVQHKLTQREAMWRESKLPGASHCALKHAFNQLHGCESIKGRRIVQSISLFESSLGSARDLLN